MLNHFLTHLKICPRRLAFCKPLYYIISICLHVRLKKIGNKFARNLMIITPIPISAVYYCIIICYYQSLPVKQSDYITRFSIANNINGGCTYFLKFSRFSLIETTASNRVQLLIFLACRLK